VKTKAIFLLSTFFLLLTSFNAFAGEYSARAVKGKDGSEYVRGEILVKWKYGISSYSASSAKRAFGAKSLGNVGRTGVEQIKLKKGETVQQALAKFKNLSQVESAEPNYIYHASVTTPDDTSFTELWGLNNTGQTVDSSTGTADADIDAPEAWDTTTGSSTVIVAILDTGVDYHHPDLNGNIWSNAGETVDGADSDANGKIDDIRGWDFVDGDNDPMDFDGHGTHVAGTVGAEGNNATGVTGVAWTVKLMPVRVLDETGSGTTVGIASGIDYAVANGAKIINMSLGGPSSSSTLHTAITAASNAGVLVVVAAGNDGNDIETTPDYPASYTDANVISVAATHQNDSLPSFSNYGATSVDIGAPGVFIYSTQPARTKVWSDNFDDGDITDWATGGTNDTWGVDTATKVSGSYSIADSPATTDYVADTASWAMTPAINLSGKQGCRVVFSYTGSSESLTDTLFVQASITTTDADFVTLKDSSDPTKNYTISGSTYASSWDTTTVSGLKGLNLTPATYDGKSTVYIRFKFTSNATSNFAGFNIDDVAVECASTTGTSDTGATDYSYKSGTSMATPMVSGVAALVWAKDSTLTSVQVKALILDNGDSISSLSGKTVTGRRLNAAGALAGTPIADTPPASSVTSSSSGGGGGASTVEFLSLALFAVGLKRKWRLEKSH